MRISPTAEAIALVKRYMPTIVVEYRDQRDVPSAFNFGELVPTPSRRPPLYFSVKCDGSRLYVLLCAYFYRDSDHRHDFSGVLAVIENDEPLYLICRRHWELVFSSADPFVLRITAGKHSFEHGDVREDYLRLDPCWRIDSEGHLDRPEFATVWYRLQNWLGRSVTLPDRWADERTDVWLSKRRGERLARYGTSRTEGLILHQPDVLVRMLEDRLPSRYRS